MPFASSADLLAYQRAYKAAHPEKVREQEKAQKHRRRAWAVSQLGGVCVQCGTEESLEFDHIDPKTKTREISSMLKLSKANLQTELDKCQLLCTTCHRIKTYEAGDLPQQPAQHGGFAMYNAHGCRCEACRVAWNVYQSSWRASKRRSGS